MEIKSNIPLTLSKDCVDGEDQKREKGRSSHDDPNNVTQQNPRKKRSDFIQIVWTNTSYRKPLKSYFQT